MRAKEVEEAVRPGGLLPAEWHWRSNRQINMPRNKIESPETDSHLYRCLIYSRDDIANPWGGWGSEGEVSFNQWR